MRLSSLILVFLVMSCGGTPFDPGPLVPMLTGDCGGLLPSDSVKSIYGLYNTPNPFGDVPAGALAIADEVTARAGGVLEPRRGMKPSVQFNADRCFPLPGTSKVLTTSRLNAQPTIYDPDLDSTTVLLGSPVMPLAYPYTGDARMSVQAAAANGNLYLTTARGIVAAAGLASYASSVQQTARPAGLPRPPKPTSGALTGTAAAVFSASSRRAYRVTLAMYDVLGNFVESAPSEQFLLNNGNGTPQKAAIFGVLPPGLGLNWPAAASPYAAPILMLRIWRAPEVPTGSTPSDEMFLIGTTIIRDGGAYPLAASGYIDTQTTYEFDDPSLDSMLTVPLYTNPRTGDGFGIASSNDTPPAAGALAQFRGRMVYGRPSFRHTLQLQIIGAGTGGIVDGDSIIVDGFTYTARSSTESLCGDFVLNTGGTPSQNISDTAHSLVDKINLNNTQPASFFAALGNGLGGPTPYTSRPEQYRVVAKYVSSDVNDFGRISIERIFPGTDGDDPTLAFSASTASSGFSFPNGTRNSTNNYFPGGLAWSKFGQPEAVPAVNFTTVGDPQKAVLGFSVHRDAVIIFKEDGAFIYRDDGGIQPSIDLLDASVVTIAPNSIGVVNNNAYVLTARGPLQVSEQGTLPVGEPILGDLNKLMRQSPSQLALAHGIGYEQDRLYVLGVPASSSEAGCSLQYVLRIPDPGYPPSPPRWTRWLRPGTTAGCVLPVQNKLVMAYSRQAPGSNLLNIPLGGMLVERKGGVCSTDFYDYSGAIACPANGTTAILTFPADVHLEMARGDVFWYNPAGPGTKVYTGRVLSVAGAVVTLDTAIPFALGSLTYFRAIQSRWRHVPMTLGEPTSEKLWRYVQFYFDYLDGDFVDVNLDSNKAQVQTASMVSNDPVIANTSDILSKVQWLRPARDVVLRVDAGQSESRGARLGVEVTHAQALASFRLLAMSANVVEVKEASTA